MMNSIQTAGGLRGGTMIYTLEFLALLGIAIALAASPFLIRLLESIFPADLNRSPSAGYGLARAASQDQSEMRDEIRRATKILETDPRRAGRDA
jgi:hypothetical protein